MSRDTDHAGAHPRRAGAWPRAWFAVAAAIVICAIVSWLHFQQQSALRQETSALGRLRQARIDLNRGLLHVLMSGEPNSAFSLQRGAALLDQASATLNEGASATDRNRPEIVAFRERLEAFRRMVGRWNTAPPEDRRALATGLRITFHGLELQAEQVDRLAAQRLRARAASLDREFAWALLAAALVMSVVCASAVAAQRASTRATAALEESEQRWRFALEGAGDGVWDWNPRTGHVTYSPSWKSSLGHAEHEIGNSLTEWSVRVHPDDLDRVQADLARHLAGQSATYACEYRLRHKDGSYRWVLDRGKVVSRASDGSPLRVVGVHTDITQHRKYEAEIERLNGLYAALSEINQTIVRVRTREELLRDVPRALVASGLFRMVWIGRRDPSTHAIVPVAKEGDETGYLDVIRVYDDERAEGLGPVGTAVRENRPTVFNDLLGDPRMLPWREAMEAARWRAAAAFPIRFEGAIWGALAVYAVEAGVFAEREISLLTEVANDVSFALDSLERERRHREDETARRDSALRLEAAVRAGHVGLWDWDLLAGRVSYSAEWKRQIGFEDREIGDSVLEWEDRIHPEDRERMIDAARAFAEDRDPQYQHVFRFRHRDGSYRWILAQAALVRDADGKPVRMIGSHVDITATMEADAALRRSESDLAAAQRIARLGSWELDVATGTGYWSDEMYRLLGLAPDRGVPTFREFLDLLHPDDRETVARLNAHCIESGEPTTIAMRSDPARGPLRYYSGNVEVVRDGDGRTVRLVGTLLDVTDRTHAEAEQRRLQDQLLQAQKMESVGRLAGGVAHDFNNMLGVIIGYAELALDTADSADPLRPYLDEILAAARRSADLTRQLLVFARKQKIAPRVLDLNDAVGSMLKMLRPLIGEDTTLVWRPAPDLFRVRIDPSQVDQVIANLVVNARDAAPGAAAITIETANAHAVPPGSTGDPSPYVVVSVKDTGEGMDEATKARIFDPFFTTKGTGTGLGLATVYGIVTQNEGFIEVDSEPGQGTTFRVYLPRAEAEPDAARQPEQPVPGGSETVLVVEDEEALLKIVERILSGLGYTVLTARTADDALRVATSHVGPIHLLVTDVVMPAIDGRELARRLAVVRPGIRNLFMSGYTSDAHASLGTDGVPFLQKPFEARVLAEKVRAVLRDT